MTTKTKPKPTWTLAEALEQLPSIGSGPPDAERRAMLVEGRTLAEHDRIISEIGYDAHGHWLLHRLAELDHAQAKAASTNGAPIPATPYLEELTRRNADMTSTKASTKRTTNGSGTNRKTADNVRFTHNGKVMAESNNRLSTQAYHFTKDIDGKARLTTREYEALLHKLGVANPYGPGWEVKLPNGHTVGAVKEGETPKPVVVDKPKATVTDIAPKQAVKAAKATTQKKAVAAAKKQGAASKPLAKKMAPRKTLAKSVPARKAKKVTSKR